jgi:hypothetical protein
MSLNERNKYKKARMNALFFNVAGPGIAPGLEDYEPSVQLYTTPHVCSSDYTNFEANSQTSPSA